jgi:hypothetical protein
MQKAKQRKSKETIIETVMPQLNIEVADIEAVARNLETGTPNVMSLSFFAF